MFCANVGLVPVRLTYHLDSMEGGAIMCCTSFNLVAHTGISTKRSPLRVIAFTLCILFIAASLFSTVFVFAHLNHTHDNNGPGGTCTTCIHMVTAKSLLRQISTAVAKTAIAVCCLFTLLFFRQPAALYSGFYTLVTLKVRLNN